MVTRDGRNAPTTETTSDATPEQSSRPKIRYAAQPIQIVAVSPEPIPNPVLSASQPSAHLMVAPEPILSHAPDTAPEPAQKGVETTGARANIPHKHSSVQECGKSG